MELPSAFIDGSRFRIKPGVVIVPYMILHPCNLYFKSVYVARNAICVLKPYTSWTITSYVLPLVRFAGAVTVVWNEYTGKLMVVSRVCVFVLGSYQ